MASENTTHCQIYGTFLSKPYCSGSPKKVKVCPNMLSYCSLASLQFVEPALITWKLLCVVFMKLSGNPGDLKYCMINADNRRILAVAT